MPPAAALVRKAHEGRQSPGTSPGASPVLLALGRRVLAAVKREPERAGMESGGFSDWIEDGMAAAANLKQTGAELRG